MEVRKATGKRVADARKRANKTQVQLALAVGVDSQTISKIERGLQTPRGTTLRGLSEALGVSPSWILDEGSELENPEAAQTFTDVLRPGAREVIDEYLRSTHGRSAPREVKARLRAGAVFESLGVTSPGWRDVDDLRNILERQRAADGHLAVSALARDHSGESSTYRPRASKRHEEPKDSKPKSRKRPGKSTKKASRR